MPETNQNNEDQQSERTATNQTDEKATYLKEKFARQAYLTNLLAEAKKENSITEVELEQLNKVVAPLSLTKEELLSEETLSYYDTLADSAKQIEEQVIAMETTAVKIAQYGQQLSEQGADKQAIDYVMDQGNLLQDHIKLVANHLNLVNTEAIILGNAINKQLALTDADYVFEITDAEVEAAEITVKELEPEIELLSAKYKAQNAEIATLDQELKAINLEITTFVNEEQVAGESFEMANSNELAETTALVNDLLDQKASPELIQEVLKANGPVDDPVVTNNPEQLANSTQDNEVSETIALVNDLLQQQAPSKLIQEVLKANGLTDEAIATPLQETEKATEQTVIQDKTETQSVAASKSEGEDNLQDTAQKSTGNNEDAQSESGSIKNTPPAFTAADLSALARVPSAASTSASRKSDTSRSQSQKTTTSKRKGKRM